MRSLFPSGIDSSFFFFCNIMDFGRKDYNDYFNHIYNHNGEIRELPFSDDEPIFLIRGGDSVGPQLLMEYAKLISLKGVDPEVSKSVFSHALKMIEWQKSHGSKIADLIRVTDYIEEKAKIDQLIEQIEIDNKLNESQFDELISLFDKVYGTNKLRVCMYHELRSIPEPPGFEPISSSDSLLTIGIIENKIIILKNKL